MKAMATKRHHVQFRVPGGKWCWVTSKGTGTLDRDAAHDFGTREAAESRAKAMSGPRSSVQAKAVSL